MSEVRAITNTETTTFAGQPVSGSDTLVMVTWGGDANLDGKINIDDYGIIDGNIGRQGFVFPTGEPFSVTAVPEPPTGGAFAMLAALARRRTFAKMGRRRR